MSFKRYSLVVTALPEEVVSLGSRRLGHSIQIKDLVREFQTLLLSRCIEGADEKRRGQARVIATRSENAAALREIAAIGTDSSLNNRDKIEQMRSLVIGSLSALDVRHIVKPGEVNVLMASLKKLLGTPDFDVIFGDIIDRSLHLLDSVLEHIAAGAQPHAADPLDPLRRRVRHLIVVFRHEEPPIDDICDKISIAIGWQCGLLGLPDTALPDLTPTLDDIHAMLTNVEAQYPLAS